MTNEKRLEIDALVKKYEEEYRRKCWDASVCEATIEEAALEYRSRITDEVINAEERKKTETINLGVLLLVLLVGGGIAVAIFAPESNGHADTVAVAKAPPSAYEIQTGDYAAMAGKNCDVAWNRLASDGGAGKFDEVAFRATCNRRMESVLTACAKKASVPQDVIECASPQYPTVMEAALVNSL